MRNISISQLVAVIFIGILLFSDFSKIVNYFRDFIKNNKIYKNLKKKVNSGKKGFEPLTFGFGNHCSAYWTILLKNLWFTNTY